MKLKFTPAKLKGEVFAPPSKSLCHRYLICASLCCETSYITNLLLSDDILATIDCLKNLGADIKLDGNTAIVNGNNFLKNKNGLLNCNESGSTLRFLIPFGFIDNKSLSFTGSKRLLQRPLSSYGNFAKENGLVFEWTETEVKVSGDLKINKCNITADISSQFVTGLIFAFLKKNNDCEINIQGKIESVSYIDLTIQAAQLFGFNIKRSGNNIQIKKSTPIVQNICVEGDESNAAFLDGFNLIGSDVLVKGLNPNTEQGDSIYHNFYKMLKQNPGSFNLENCPDLAPVLMALSSMLSGAMFTGIKRLQYKESDRGNAMMEELTKFDSHISISNDCIIVGKIKNVFTKEELNSHNDHRIAMALSLLLVTYGGILNGAECVSKSYPDYWDVLKSLGAQIEIISEVN